ncbi:hypothetical protein NLJ89_g11587 [Agrocybe chaxingu]|uniref:Uncharacterized protein n=1 Tax=Agrocybe chaxingu TaxID=84603 RepID=A0A9W8JLM0_9AGAR|nr:hypothetical protein NLJ89_g11587 [Agrocybe chaxingu]
MEIDNSERAFVYLLLGSTWWNRFETLDEIKSSLRYRPAGSFLPVLIRCKAQNADVILAMRQELLQLGFGTTPISGSNLAENVAVSTFLSSSLASDNMWFGNAFGCFQGVYQNLDHVKEANHGVAKVKFRRFFSFQGALSFVLTGGDLDFCVRHGFLKPPYPDHDRDSPSAFRVRTMPSVFVRMSSNRNYGVGTSSAPSTPRKNSNAKTSIAIPRQATGQPPKIRPQSPILSAPSSPSTMSTVSSLTASTSIAPAPHSSLTQMIYSFWRDLKGIIRAEFRPTPTWPVGDILGEVVESYLVMHGYDDPSIEAIRRIYFDSQTRAVFVRTLQVEGMAAAEAGWIWDHISVREW